MVLKWEKGHVKSSLGKKALVGGKDSDGSLIYVGRAFHNGIHLPAKVIPSKNACYVAYNGLEIFVENFEVAAAKEKKFSWESSSDGRISAGAVSTGRDGNDEVYIGRAVHQGSLTVGKIIPSHKCIYIPYGGREVRLPNYEILIYKKAQLQWMSGTPQTTPIPANAVIGGRDTDGSTIYVGRAAHQGDLLPCKIIPQKLYASVPCDGFEVPVLHFDFLVGNKKVKWKKEKNGKIPKGAFPGGRTRTGEILYVGRAEHNGSLTVGKVHPSHGCLYIPYGQKEFAYKTYEVLTGY